MERLDGEDVMLDLLSLLYAWALEHLQLVVCLTPSISILLLLLFLHIQKSRAIRWAVNYHERLAREAAHNQSADVFVSVTIIVGQRNFGTVVIWSGNSVDAGIAHVARNANRPHLGVTLEYAVRARKTPSGTWVLIVGGGVPSRGWRFEECCQYPADATFPHRANVGRPAA